MKTLMQIRSRKETLACLFKGYEPLAKKLAYQFSQAYRMPFDDCMEEALFWLGVVVARWDQVALPGQSGIYTFDRTKSKPTTYVYNHLRWKLMDFCSRKRERTVAFSVLDRRGEEEESFDAPAKPPAFLPRLMEILGEDAKEFVHTILHAPADLISDLVPCGEERRRAAMIFPNSPLYELFRRRGWDDNRIVETFREVQAAL